MNQGHRGNGLGGGKKWGRGGEKEGTEGGGLVSPDPPEKGLRAMGKHGKRRK